MRRFAFWLSLTVPALAVGWGAWRGTFPLGVSGEWAWERVDPTGSLTLSLIPPLVAASLYIGFVWLGSRRSAHCGPTELAAWLCGLSLCGFTWLWVVQESAPQSYQLSKAAWVLYFRGSSGYYSEAREAARDLPAYLAGYEALMARGDVLHIGTHPPGLVIIFRGLLDLFETFPRFADVVTATEPDSVREAFITLQQTATHAQDPLPRADRAALWLATLLVQGGVALTVLPLFGLLRQSSSRRASWLAAAFWPTVPSLAVFLPKSDCLYALLAAGFLWLWLTGLSRRSSLLCSLSGLTACLGMLLSLALLPVAFMALLMTLARNIAAATKPENAPDGAVGAGHDDRTGARPRLWIRLHSCLLPMACALGGFIIPSLAARLFLHLNLVHVWWLNLQNHAGFYRQFPRTYTKWLLVNPIEFLVAVGTPLAVLAAWSVVRQWRLADDRPRNHFWAWLATIGILWISGKNMGEAARLWIFLIPGVIWMAGPLFDLPVSRPAASPADPHLNPGAAAWELLPGATWVLALAIQLATTTAIATRVVGFHYP